MKRGLVLSLVAMASAALGACGSHAATVTLTLDIYYRDGADAGRRTEAGTAGAWQLTAVTSTGDNRGIAGVDTALTGVVNSVATSSGHTFRAPNGAATVGGVAGQAGFQTTYDAKTWAQEQDADALTADMLFGQVPVGTPNQGLFYDVGNPLAGNIKGSGDAAAGQPAVTGLASTVTWNFDDRLGDLLGDGNQANNNGANQRGVLLAQGTFLAGSTPAFAPGGSAANVFTALGTAAAAPGTGTIQSATVNTVVRTNVNQLWGDANLDNDVDVFQSGGNGDAAILTANLGKTGNALWQEGDFSGDKDVDVFQSGGLGDAAILTASLGATDAPAGTATAKYNPANGQMVLDIGAGLGVVGIESVGNINLGVPVVPAPQQYDANAFAYFNPAGIAAQIITLNGVFKTGLGASDFVFGFVPIGGNEVVASVAIVPEPATLGLVAFGLIAGVAASRKRIAA